MMPTHPNNEKRKREGCSNANHGLNFTSTVLTGLRGEHAVTSPFQGMPDVLLENKSKYVTGLLKTKLYPEKKNTEAKNHNESFLSFAHNSFKFFAPITFNYIP